MVQLHQAGHRLAERAVPAGADHPVELAAQLGGDAGGIRLPLGGIDGGQVARLGKDIQNSGQIGRHPPLAGGGVVEKKHGFQSWGLTFYEIGARSVPSLDSPDAADYELL